MISSGRHRLVHKPGLSYPWVVQMQRQDGRWVFFESRKDEAAAKKVLERLQRYEAEDIAKGYKQR